MTRAKQSTVSHGLAICRLPTYSVRVRRPRTQTRELRAEPGVTALERHCRLLLRVYPAWYRRERAEEMLGTLLEACPPGRSWPSSRDTRALIAGGLRVRGPLTPCLSVLWAVLGALGAGYNFMLSQHVPEASYGPGVQPWVGESGLIVTAAGLGAVAWVLLTIPVLVAGLVRIYRGRLRAGPAAVFTVIAWAWVVVLALLCLLAAEPAPVVWIWVLLTIPVLVAGLVRLYRRRLRAAGVAAGLLAIAWTCLWIVGLVLMYKVASWQPTAAPIMDGNCSVGQGCFLAGYRHAVVSREELVVLAGWLVLGAAMALILASTRFLRIREIRAISSA
jgi:hypothetical protein